jgi:hypothetical protein
LFPKIQACRFLYDHKFDLQGLHGKYGCLIAIIHHLGSLRNHLNRNSALKHNICRACHKKFLSIPANPKVTTFLGNLQSFIIESLKLDDQVQKYEGLNKASGYLNQFSEFFFKNIYVDAIVSD